MLEWMQIWIGIANIAVIAGGALVAVRQLSLSYSGNQLQHVARVVKEFNRPDLQRAFREVQKTLANRLDDPAYRAELAHSGFIDTDKHPEISICNWLDSVGAIVKYKLISEDAFMDLFGRLVAYYWDLVAPAVAIMRRERGSTQYHNFEYLAARAKAWIVSHPDGMFPPGYRRLPIADPWAAIDAERSDREISAGAEPVRPAPR